MTDGTQLPIEQKSSTILFDPMETFRQWLELQSLERIAEIIIVIGEQLEKDTLTHIVGYDLHRSAGHLRILIERNAMRQL